MGSSLLSHIIYLRWMGKCRDKMWARPSVHFSAWMCVMHSHQMSGKITCVSAVQANELLHLWQPDLTSLLCTLSSEQGRAVCERQPCHTDKKKKKKEKERSLFWIGKSKYMKIFNQSKSIISQVEMSALHPNLNVTVYACRLLHLIHLSADWKHWLPG